MTGKLEGAKELYTVNATRDLLSLVPTELGTDKEVKEVLKYIEELKKKEKRLRSRAVDIEINKRNNR